MKALRIAHVSATFPPYFSGTGNVCYHNARQLARRGHRVSVFTAALPGEPAVEDSDDLHVERLRPLFRTGNAPLLPQLSRRLDDFDIIHLHYPFFGGEGAALAAKRRGTPLVITYHQDVLLGGLGGLVEKMLRPSLSRWVLRNADRLLFTSLDYARSSHVRPLLSGREAHIAAQPNGVDTQKFTPDPPSPALAAQYRQNAGDFIILLVATLDRAHYFKGVDVLLEALAALPAAYRAIIVGEGNLRASYQDQAQRLGLDGRAHFAGRVADADLPDFYRLADVTVLPSTTMGEAFGLVLVESMACATPVIASSLPGVRSVVSEGVDGGLVQPGDSSDLHDRLEWLGQMSPAQRRQMGLAGRRKVEECYTWPYLAGRLENTYRELLN